MKRGLLFLLLWPLASAKLGATEYYVAPTGDDRNPGTITRPLLTIQKCADLARAGDTCFIQAGSYYERVSPPNFGAPGNLIVFQASGTVVMRGFTLRTGYVRVHGFEITDTPNVFPDTYGVYLEGEGYEVLDNLIHHTTWDGINCSKSGPSVARALIRGNTIRYADGTGITLYGQANIAERNDISHILYTTGRDADGIRFFGQGHVIRDNFIHDITEAEAPGAHTDCMQTFDNSQPPTNDVLIEGNYCYNLDHQMLMISAETKRQSSRITIRNNIFESPPNPPNWQLIYVIQVTQVAVVHNTFINARYRGLYIGDGATQATVKNNVFYNVPRYYEIEANSITGFQVGHNLNYPLANPPSEPGGVYQDPQFRDLANRDFHLKNTSPAIDAGEDVGVSLDKDGKPRPQGPAPDIGAFEFVVPTSVTLGSFTASAGNGAVALAWQTVSEIDNLGFHLYRATSEGGPYERITAHLIPGLGSSPVGAGYSYRDIGLQNGTTYYYKLEDVETTGQTNLHGPVWATPGLGASSGRPPKTGPSEGGDSARITYGDPSANSLRVIRAGGEGLVLELTTHGFYAEPQEDGTVRLSIPDFETVSRPGGPSMPVMRTWVNVVAGLRVELGEVETQSVEAMDGLRPAGAELSEIVATPEGTAYVRQRPSGARPQGASVYPENASRLLSVGFQGEAKKALVELAPLRWDGTTGRLLLTRRLVVHLSFSGRETGETRAEGGGARRHVERRSHAKREVLARLVTTERGLYEVPYEDVLGADRSGVHTRSLRLSRQGEPVAFHVEPDSPRFRPGSRLYFLSEGASVNPYGKEAVYELELAEGGMQMESIPASPSGAETASYRDTRQFEQNRYYQAGLLDAPDLWLWDLLLAPVRKSYSFPLSALSSRSEPARLIVWLQGASDFPVSPDHHVRLYLNRALAQEVSWEGKQPRRVEVELPPGILVEGENSLEIENVGDTVGAYSMVMLDRFAVDFPRRLEVEADQLRGRWSESGTATVRGPGSAAHVLEVTEEPPRWLEDLELTDDGTVRFRVEAGRSYLAVWADAVRLPELRRPRASVLKRADRGADYLVLGPEEFLREAESLLTLRRSQGLQVQAVGLEQVYEEFGFGEGRPEAIRDFLEYAYQHWPQPSPRYVLLLGDGSYDFKDYLGTGVVNRVPPLVIRTPYLWTASDPALAALNGEDLLPDVAIGRLPAANAEELRGMVDKIVAYETGGANLSSALFLVADDPDRAGDFVADADEIANSVLSGHNLNKLYLSELGVEPMRRAILDAFDGGASLLSYIGHGGTYLWASENVFNTKSVDSLAAQSQQPVLVTLNCLNGFFHFPYFDSLAEAALKAKGRGAIAAFSPSGMSLNEPAHRFHKAFLGALFDLGHERLGDALLAAQSAYAESGPFPELLSVYHLFGDPALKLRH